MHNGSLVFSSKSYILKIPSCPPVARYLEHGEKSNVLTMCLCGNVYNSFPVIASHTFTLKSPDAVAARLPNGSCLHDHTAP